MSPVRLKKTEEAARLALEFQAAFNRRDADGLARLFSEDCLYQSADSAAPDCAGREALARFWRDWFARAPQTPMETEEVFGMGNRCVLLWKRGGLRGAEIFEIKEGLIYRQYSYVKGK